MNQEMITQDGEIVERASVPQLTDTAGLSAIVRAEIDAQIVTARQFPRSLQRVIGNITTLATLDEETAAESLYALVRKKKQRSRNSQANDEENKPIEGPSIRLAEIAAQCYGNCRIEARTVFINRAEKYVEAEGIFHDLETNMASKATVRRRISTSGGYLFSEDMILVTANAACAIAKRNAILAGIPRGVYRPGYMAARKIVAGTAETLASNREKAIKAFATFGVTPEQIFEAIGVEGEREIKTDHIATLRAMFMTLKNGEATVEEMFHRADKQPSDHQTVEDPLSDKPASQDAPAEEGEAAADADKLTGEPASAHPEDNSQSSDTSTDEGSGDTTASGVGDPAADSSAPTGDEGEAGQIEAGDGPTASSASPDLSDEQVLLLRIFRTMQDCVGPSVEDFNQAFKIFDADLADASDTVKRKAETIRASLEFCCGDNPKRTKLQARTYLAGLIGVEEAGLD